MTDPQREIREWLAEELAKMGRGAKSKLAKHLGVGPDVITRMTNSDTGKESRGIKADELVKIQQFFSSSPGNLTETSKNPSNSRDSTLEKTNASSVSYADLAARKGIPVVGTVAAGSLKEVADMEDERPEDYPRAFGVHSKRFPTEWQYALDVEGDSMNQFAPEGSLVVCVDVVASGIEIVSGMKVHVQHFRFGGQVVEQTLKTVHFEKGKMVLVPESTNPRWKPIIFNGADYDNGDEFDQVVIKGVVVRKMTDEAL